MERDKVKEIYDYALSKSYDHWIDEKGTPDNPGFARGPSKLTYEEAFSYISENLPHWVISFRNNSYFNEIDYWEFAGCDIAAKDCGSFFIWIKVIPEEAEKIFQKFNLKKEYYGN